ncbi:MAG: hypothetical protein C5B49_06705 [Bdellovibrio sp.]|nr:MAG: hypothetical protein C5B49_06705 [Bdellovibrio sp.]
MFDNTFVSFIEIPYQPATESFARTRLDLLTETAPSDSVASCLISKDSNGFVAQIRLRSSDLRINIARKSRSPFMAIERAFNEANIEIQRWKYQRDFDQDQPHAGGSA